MPAGASGRIVIDIDPVTKQQIYAALKGRGLTMREWLLTMSRGDLGVPVDVARGGDHPTQFPSHTERADGEPG